MTTTIASPSPTITSHTGTFKLNSEQQAALDAMVAWANAPSKSGAPFFVLEGFAGTGKTFTCKALIDHVRGRMCFTAPTNKAVKVLRQTLTNDSYRPECATIYSLLGLQMVANGEVKELKGRDKDSDDKLDLSVFKIVVVDEGSMVNKVLMNYITQAAREYNIRFLFMGDPAQLPPVGETASPIWGLAVDGYAGHAALRTVMRHDNQILELVTRIREVVDHFAPQVGLKSNFDDQGGVHVVQADSLRGRLIQEAECGRLSKPNGSKLIAWRNVKVDEYNRLARRTLYGDEQSRIPYIVGDRVLFTGPAMDLDDKPMARTDDEGEVTTVGYCDHPVYPEYQSIRLGITLDDNRTVTAFTLNPVDHARFDRDCNVYAAEKRWRDFWALKEAFHGIRHAYAITAHRAQGSTYHTALVDYRDILLNRNRQEAYRCLYVACSRPTTELWLG